MIYSCRFDIIFQKENMMNSFFKRTLKKLFIFKKIGFEKDKTWPKKLDPIRIQMILDSDHRYTDQKCILNFENFIEIPDYIKRSPYSKEEAELVSKALKKDFVSGEEWMFENWNCISHPYITTFFYDFCGKEAEVYFTSEGGAPFPIAKKISEVESCKVSLLWESLDSNKCGTDSWKDGKHISHFEDDVQRDSDGTLISHLS